MSPQKTRNKITAENFHSLLYIIQNWPDIFVQIQLKIRVFSTDIAVEGAFICT